MVTSVQCSPKRIFVPDDTFQEAKSEYLGQLKGN